MMGGLIYAENRKIHEAVKIDLRKVLSKNDYSKGHLPTRLKGLIDMIRNHFSLYVRTQLVLICINLNSSATKFSSAKENTKLNVKKNQQRDLENFV